MNSVDPKHCEDAMLKIKDGFVFEDFGKCFISSIRGVSFNPVGGLKDKGIDGFEFVCSVVGNEKSVYQFSIEGDAKSKIFRTKESLEKNEVENNKLYYVTNKLVPGKDKIIEEFYDKYNNFLNIYDLNWICTNINANESSVRAFVTFADSYLHEFEKPGRSYEVMDIVSNPRLYVFLRQQWDDKKNYSKTDSILADTLILYSLEETDPDKKVLMSRAEIFEKIKSIAQFDIKSLSEIIDRRLGTLSKKPRKINHHRLEDKYCLPFETRLEIQRRNLEERLLYDDFQRQAELQLKSYLKQEDAIVRNCLSLIDKTFHTIFHQQGIEFANFILNGDNPDAIEKNVPEIVARVVDESSITPKNKSKVKMALLMTIRDIVYNGREFQKDFLARLSNTYMMLFMLRCDPAVSTFFYSMASKMTVFVDTSILVPALSEYFLPEENKRYWALLKAARNAGVTLVVNNVILEELVSSIRKSIVNFEINYARNESLYDSEETILYVDDIFSRAYFYSKNRGQVSSFSSFIENFLSYNGENSQEDMALWLKEEFSITCRSEHSFGVTIDEDELERLTHDLASRKSKDVKARNDAMTILSIYSLRDKNNEKSDGGILGYRTWWLSTDSATFESVKACFKEKYSTSCYMRPDFLYNYIHFTPTKDSVDATYKRLFPTLLGANISFHLPQDIIDYVSDCIKDHASKNTTRVKAVLRQLTDKLKTESSFRGHKVKLYLDEKMAELKD